MRTNRQRRRGVVSLVGLAALMLLASCTDSARPTVNELVWAVGGIDAAENGPADKVVDLWNRDHPKGPTVKVEALPAVADDQRQLMAVELDAGLEGLDILSLDVIWTAEFAENGWLVELQTMREHMDDVSLPGPLQTAIWNEKLWAAPFTTNAGILFYRTDLVPAGPPPAWESLKDVGIATGRAAGIAPFVGQGAQYEGLVVTFSEYLWAAGGELLNPEATEVRFEPGPAGKALDFMQRSSAEGFYHPEFGTMTEDTALDEFMSGRAVFMRNWPYAWAEVNGPDSRVRGRVGIAPLPTFDRPETAPALGGQNLAVSRFSKNVPAAKEFVRFASTNLEAQTILRQDSRPPAMKAAYENLGDNEELMSVLGEVLESAKPRSPVPEWATISDEIQQQVFPVYTRPSDPASAKAEDAIAAIRSFMERVVQEQ